MKATGVDKHQKVLRKKLRRSQSAEHSVDSSLDL